MGMDFNPANLLDFLFTECIWGVRKKLMHAFPKINIWLVQCNISQEILKNKCISHLSIHFQLCVLESQGIIIWRYNEPKKYSKMNKFYLIKKIIFTIG